MQINWRGLNRALDCIDSHLRAGSPKVEGYEVVLKALIEALRRGIGRAVIRADKRGASSIFDIAYEYLSSAEKFSTANYAHIVSDALSAGQLDYSQAEFSLSAYESVGLIKLSQQLSLRDDQGGSACILESLRLCAAVKLDEFMDDVVPIGKFLERDPLAPYSALALTTKSRYRQAACEQAQAQKISIEEVAEGALENAYRAFCASQSPRAHSGYHLLCNGSVTSSAFAYDWHRLQKRLFGYALTNLMISIALGLLLQAPLMPTNAYDLILIIALLLILFQATIPISESLLGSIVGARIPLRLDFVSTGLPDQCKAVIAVPMVLVSKSQIDEVLSHAKWNLQTSADTNVSLALLTDFADGAEPGASDYELELLDYLSDELKKLHEHMPDIVLLHRDRKVFRDGKWTGWERKRGKLLQLNDLIEAERNEFSLTIGNVEKLIGARYVLCLDEDSRISRDCIQLLAGVLAHPLNRPVISEDGKGIVSGYGLVVPRFVTRTESLNTWRVSFPFSGPRGSERERVIETRNFLFDWTGVTQYPGKGLYDVRVFQTLMGRDALPEGRILSHDTIEGAVLRCAYDGKVVISEGFPQGPLSLLLRNHRWTRGDMQNYLQLWLLASEKVRTLIADTQFGFMVNMQLRACLVYIAISMVTLSWCFQDTQITRSAGRTMLLALIATPVARIMLQAWEDFLTGQPLVIKAFRHLIGVSVGVTLRVVSAWTTAWVIMDAMLRTCWRLAFGGMLFEWRSAALIQASKTEAISIPGVIPASVAAGLVVILVFKHGNHAMSIIVPVVWVLYPFVIAPLLCRSKGAPS